MIGYPNSTAGREAPTPEVRQGFVASALAPSAVLKGQEAVVVWNTTKRCNSGAFTVCLREAKITGRRVVDTGGQSAHRDRLVFSVPSSSSRRGAGVEGGPPELIVTR